MARSETHPVRRLRTRRSRGRRTSSRGAAWSWPRMRWTTTPRRLGDDQITRSNGGLEAVHTHVHGIRSNLQLEDLLPGGEDLVGAAVEGSQRRHVVIPADEGEGLLEEAGIDVGGRRSGRNWRRNEASHDVL